MFTPVVFETANEHHSYKTNFSFKTALCHIAKLYDSKIEKAHDHLLQLMTQKKRITSFV